MGVGKMGVSHYAILGAHPRVEVTSICDSMSYLTSALRKHTGVQTFKDYRQMIDSGGVDCLFIATPTATHFDAASYALARGLHVFVEKPLCLEAAQSKQLAEFARAKGRANQVGYHNRFIGTFRECRRLVREGALGEIYHVSGTSFGQVGDTAEDRPHMAIQEIGRWRLPARLRLACHGSDELHCRPAGAGARRASAPHLLQGRRGRGVRAAPLPRRRQRSDRDELERRQLPEDEHHHHRIRHPGQDHRGPAGMPRLPAR